MKYYVYILKSETCEKTYVGMTNNLERRIKEHNSGKSKYTSKFIPWKVIYKEEMGNRKEAREKEKYYKSAAGRRKMKQIIKNSGPV